jgi:CheY-like chemotaxis protein
MADTDPDNPTIEFIVSDTGIGMNQAQLAKLFRPFTQVDASMTRKFGGTGLGLTISKSLANALGGDLSAECVLNEGCTFYLTVPTRTSNEFDQFTASPGDIQVYNQNTVQSKASPKASDLNVLLVEDSLDNQKLISFFLKKSGFEVTLAENGQIAADIVMKEKRSFGVILMDMQMPVLDGYEATKLLRQEGYTGPIVAITAHGMSDDREKCLAAGCDDYLTKPIKREQLVDVVTHYSQTVECS